MRQLATSVAILVMVSAAVVTPAATWAQDGAGAGLRDALSEAQAGDTSALGEAMAVDRDPPSLMAFPTDEAPVLLGPEELDELVAPLALYPDPLLAQALVAATYPLQVAKADQLIAASAEMPKAELTDALARQDFDPSVLVLMTGFPTVVARMAEDLDWTERLGMAVLAQDEDVLEAVQRMRANAEAVGNLESNEAQTVEEDAGEIYIRPTDPEVVYVPSYDPVTTYSMPFTETYSAPYPAAPRQGTSSSGFSPLQNPLVAGALAFGGAMLVSELFGDDDGDHDDDDDGDDGWDDYWQHSRPIAWHDRAFYPRPVPRHASVEDSWSWGQERDRYWDGGARRWRPDAARDVRRKALSEAVVDGHAVTATRMRELAREQKEERARVADRLEERAEGREERARAAAREERARTRALRNESAEAARRRDVEAKAAAPQEEREKAAMARKERSKAAAARQERDKARAAKQKQANDRAEKREEDKAAAKREGERKRKRDRAAAPRKDRDKAAAGEAKQRKAAALRRERDPAAATRAKQPRTAEAERKRDKAAKADRAGKTEKLKAARAKAAKAEKTKAAKPKQTEAKRKKAGASKTKARKKELAAAASASREQQDKPAKQKKAAARKKDSARKDAVSTKLKAKKKEKKCNPDRQECKR